jgi:hypothetical protein
MNARVRAHAQSAGRAVTPKAVPRRSGPTRAVRSPGGVRSQRPNLDASGVLGLQRIVGNAVTGRILASAPTQLRRAPVKTPPPVLQSLAVTNAVAVKGSTDHFVAAKGAPAVTVAATVDDPAKIKPGLLTWSGGTAGGNAAQREVATGSIGTFAVKATAGSVSKTVTIHVPATAPPAANPAAPLTHTKIGASAPGTNFGLTVVTIGQQGVKRPEFDIDVHVNGDQWAFRVRAIRHGFKVGVASQGRTDIAGPGDSDIKPSTIGLILTDLAPPPAGTPNGPPRTTFWTKTITEAHEQAHVDRFYTDPAFWPAAMGRFEATVEGTTVDFDHTKTAAATAAEVLKANKGAFETAVVTEHNAADAAEIAGSEVAAHGVSNPMYAALLTAIRDTVVPPAPTGMTAVPGGGGAVVITWAAAAANETGFVVERRVGKAAFATAGDVATAARTFTDAGVAPGTKVTYRVRAKGVAGNSAGSNVQTVTTTP